ncbi:hypothetical protein [Methylobacterium nodulans]|uniref:hypothetical protein n=1 Tax=Methylobacterium nodulans TaxID=114616 RepID=UPI0012EE38D6|nr:hypothetical protein [Methylobacterium nodulans]
MKWVLLWIAIGANGDLTSGSAQFDTIDACYAAEKAYKAMYKDYDFRNITAGRRTIYNDVRTVCINSEKGDAMSIISPPAK